MLIKHNMSCLFWFDVHRKLHERTHFTLLHELEPVVRRGPPQHAPSLIALKLVLSLQISGRYANERRCCRRRSDDGGRVRVQRARSGVHGSLTAAVTSLPAGWTCSSFTFVVSFNNWSWCFS